jgi:uncharacterized protein
MRFGLPDGVLSKILDVLTENNKVDRVVLYGSRAKGNARKGSDIDLCLDAEELTLQELIKLETQIDDLLLPWKVDITILHQIDNPALLEHIERIGVHLYPSL